MMYQSHARIQSNLIGSRLGTAVSGSSELQDIVALGKNHILPVSLT